MVKKGPPPPVATGKASLLHYFSSSPSIRTDSASVGSSSPARAGPSRANSLPQATTSASASSTGAIKSADQPTPRAPLRATQSLGSLDSSLRACTSVNNGGVAASTSVPSSASGAALLPIPASANRRRSPRLRLTPPVEESEDEYRPAREPLVKGESLTPRRNPPRQAALNSSPALSPLSATRPAPRSPRDVPSQGKGKSKAVEAHMSDSDLASHVKKEKRSSYDPLDLCTPSPAKRARQRKKRIFAFTKDEHGRDVIDLTLSSPSAASIATLSSDSDSEVFVLSTRRSSRTPSLSNKSNTSTPSRRVKQEHLASMSRSGAAAASPLLSSSQKTPRRTQAIASGEKAVRTAGESSSRAVAQVDEQTTTPTGPNTVGGGGDTATPTRSGLGIRVSPDADGLAPITPRRSGAAEAAYTPTVSVTLASISPPRLDDQEMAASDPSTPSRAGPSAPPVSQKLPDTTRPSLNADGLHSPERTVPAGLVSSAAFHTPTALSPTKSPQKLTNSAVRRLSVGKPQKAGNSDSIFIRSPSGSPLSSLAPTPVRSTSRVGKRPQASPSRSAKSGIDYHTFDLIIDLPPLPTTSSAKKHKLDRHGASGSGTKKPTQQKSSRPASAKKSNNLREWELLMGEASEAEDANREDSDRETSPSPAKIRKTDSGKKRRAPSKAPSSSSSSDAESSSNEEELASFLERARARRQAGETLASTTGTSPSAATAPTTVSPPSPETSMRRSHRVRQETDHYVPGVGSSKPATARAQPTGGKKAPPSLFEGRREARDGRDAFNKIMRDRKREEEQGHTAEWYAKWRRELQGNGDEDGMNGDSAERGAKAGQQATSALAQVQSGDTAGFAAAFAADSDDELEPPKAVQAAAQSKAEVAGKLIDEERAREAAQNGDGAEAILETRQRTVWKDGPARIQTLATLSAEMQGDGWIGSIAAILRAGIQDPSTMPSPILLASKFSVDAACGSEAERHVVVGWLYQLICHPSPPYKLVSKLQALLAGFYSWSAFAQTSGIDLEFDRIHLPLALRQVGLKAAHESDEGEENSAGARDEASDANFLDVDQALRSRVVRRWCGFIHTLLTSVRPSLKLADTVKLAELLVRLALDPGSATLRSCLRNLLRLALDRLHKLPLAAGQLYARLAERYRDARPRVQLAVLQALPHANEQDKQLRRWLACALLAQANQYTRLSAVRDLSMPVLPHLREMLASPSADSVFVPKANAAPDVVADGMLIDRARMLMLSLASLSYEIYDRDDRNKLRKDLDAIVAHIRKIDSRFRADARKGLAVERLLAKNLFTALVHSLTYQLRAARGQKAGSDLTEEATRALATDDRGSKTKGAPEDPKQLKLSFGRAPKSNSTPNSVNARSPLSAGSEDDNMVSDISDDEGLLRL
ncbi:hypothetical protein JCM10908_002128 [Rhodotorula pacifica]|uniref:uncharacterized protein n=1 Tax=Rhodotorula pacifica TaxID=1495444 RepID=UPI00318012C5